MALRISTEAGMMFRVVAHVMITAVGLVVLVLGAILDSNAFTEAPQQNLRLIGAAGLLELTPFALLWDTSAHGTYQSAEERELKFHNQASVCHHWRTELMQVTVIVTVVGMMCRAVASATITAVGWVQGVLEAIPRKSSITQTLQIRQSLPGGVAGLQEVVNGIPTLPKDITVHGGCKSVQGRELMHHMKFQIQPLMCQANQAALGPWKKCSSCELRFTGCSVKATIFNMNRACMPYHGLGRLGRLRRKSCALAFMTA
mmetsp:Transcript_129797/g.224557  ORF Transcript_129797/g.224557 Transcript_129797/m.224557 type:complete len:258 (-) Transcript_129797:1485-2258(-)